MTGGRKGTQARLEEVAIRLFSTKGIRETTIKDIAQAAGLSEGALYRHFTSKDDLVWRAFERRYVALAFRLKIAAETGSATRERLAAMIHEICQAHDDDPAAFHFLVFVQHGQLGRLAPDTPTPVTVVRDLLSTGIASGELPGQDVDLATALVFGLVLQPMTFAAYGRLPGPQTAHAARLAAAAWAALMAVAAPAAANEGPAPS
jgi:AcrR family transcriptional regulator